MPSSFGYCNDDGDHTIANYTTDEIDPDEQIANARLISAAPELLAVCSLVIVELEALQITKQPENILAVTALLRIEEAAYAAVAKVAGIKGEVEC